MILDTLKKKKLEYLKAKDSEKLGYLSFFLSIVQNKEIELRTSEEELTDEVVFKLLRKQIKNRRDMIKTYTEAGRDDLVEKETKEHEFYMELSQLFPFELNLPPVENA